MVKNLPANAGDTRNTGLIPGFGRFPGVGNGNPLQYSCLEIPMDAGAWWATVHRVTKSRTRLSDFTSPLWAFGQESDIENNNQFGICRSDATSHYSLSS